VSHRHSERYQLPFDFAEEPQEIAVSAYAGYVPTFAGVEVRADGADRFVHRVKETWVVNAPSHAADYLYKHIFADPYLPTQEEMWALLLNTKYRITHHALLYRGLVDSVPIRVAEVYRDAIRLGAPRLIVSHCHPSGDPTPSPEDVLVTQQLHRAGELLGIDLMDHIIIGENDWVSLREKKLGFV